MKKEEEKKEKPEINYMFNDNHTNIGSHASS